MENAVRDLASQVRPWLKWWNGKMETFTSEWKSDLPLVWRTRSSMLVDRRPYNDQNKDRRVERRKDRQQLSVRDRATCFPFLFTVYFEFENWILYESPEVNRLSSVTCQDYTVLQLWSPGIFCVGSSVDKLSGELLPMLYVLFLLVWTSLPIELFWRDCMFLFV